MFRVLHAPVNVGNQPWVLSRHERALGIHSDLVVNYATWLQYPADRCLGRRDDSSWPARWRRFRFALAATWRYDVLHYYFGQSFFSCGDFRRPNWRWFKDVDLAKRLGRKVFMTLQGCDVRLSDRSAARNEITMCGVGHCEAAAHCRAEQDAARRMLIQRILPRMDRVFVLNPELAWDVPGAEFLPYACVDVAALGVTPPQTAGEITILHAPSDPAKKGTRFVRDAVERLGRHFPIRFLQVSGLPHAEAMKLYPQADLVIDQVLGGWYGGFAVELMAMGKPVACYIRDEDLHFIPPAMAAQLPLLRVRPDTLEEDLRRAISLRAAWPAWGQQSRQFVLRWHHPGRIARAMIEIYRNPRAPLVLE
ncbi:MAG: glycosyltransferase [Thermoguttaceae bacterium]